MNAPAQIPPYIPPPAPLPGPGVAPPSEPARRGRGGTILLLLLGVAGTGLGAYILWYATRFSFLREDELLQAAAIGGAGLVLLALGVQRLLRGSRGWIAGGAAFAMPAAAAALVIVRAMSAADAADAADAARDALSLRLKPVCTEARALPEAAAYARAPGTHPTAFFTTTSSGETYDWAPDAAGGAAWTPASVEQTQLVACIMTEKETVEGCSYSTSKGDRFITRVRYVVSIALYEARTRTLVAEGRVEGSQPDPCPETATFRESDFSKELAGTLPSDDKLVEIVRPWIEGAGR